MWLHKYSGKRWTIFFFLLIFIRDERRRRRRKFEMWLKDLKVLKYKYEEKCEENSILKILKYNFCNFYPKSTLNELFMPKTFLFSFVVLLFVFKLLRLNFNIHLIIFVLFPVCKIFFFNICIKTIFSPFPFLS